MDKFKVLIFRVGKRWMALPFRNVKEIKDSFAEVQPVFYGGKGLRGILNSGGEPVSVLDTSFILDEGSAEGSFILQCADKEKGIEVGLMVEEIKGMVLIDQTTISNPQEGEDDFVLGTIEMDKEGEGSTASFLDLMKLLDLAETKIDKL